MAHINLKRPRNVAPGVAEKVLIAPLNFFAEGGIKSPTPPFLNPGDEVSILASHEFLTGRGWITVLLAPEKNQFGAVTSGDKGFQFFQKSLDVFIPGSYALLHEMIKNMLNVPLIAIIKDRNCAADIWYQLGTSCVPAYISVDFTTGTTKDGIKGYAGKITSSLGFVQFYKGSTTDLITEEEMHGILTEDGENIPLEDNPDINLWEEEAP